MGKVNQQKLLGATLMLGLMALGYYIFLGRFGDSLSKPGIRDAVNAAEVPMHATSVLPVNAEEEHDLDSEIRQFLSDQGRSPENLLAVYALTRDEAYLRDVALEFPQSLAVMMAVVSSNLFSDDRLDWLDRLVTADPENSLARYLLAQEFLLNNETESGLEQLYQATALSDFSHHAEATGEAIRLFLQDYATISEREYRSLLLNASEMLPSYSEKLTQLGLTVKRIMRESSPEARERIALLGYSLALRISEKGEAADVAIGLGLEGLFRPYTNEQLVSAPQEEIDSQWRHELDRVKGLSNAFTEVASGATIDELLTFQELVFTEGELRAIEALVEEQSLRKP